MPAFPVHADPARAQARGRAVAAIAAARRMFPAPIAAVLVDEITWGLDNCSALAHRGRHTALVDAVLGMADMST